MLLSQLIKSTIKELRDRNCRYAVAGGIAASIYRKDIRATEDADFLILSEDNSQKAAEDILHKLKLKIGRANLANLTKAQMMNKKRLPTVILVGRADDSKGLGIDFILPSMPWALSALERAQTNLLNIGFGEIPIVTKEDLIISKCFSYNNAPKRIKDLDDLISIFEFQREFDLSYLCGELDRLKLPIPKEVYDIAPKALRVLSKRLKGI